MTPPTLTSSYCGIGPWHRRALNHTRPALALCSTSLFNVNNFNNFSTLIFDLAFFLFRGKCVLCVTTCSHTDPLCSVGLARVCLAMDRFSLCGLDRDFLHCVFIALLATPLSCYLFALSVRLIFVQGTRGTARTWWFFGGYPRHAFASGDLAPGLLRTCREVAVPTIWLPGLRTGPALICNDLFYDPL